MTITTLQPFSTDDRGFACEYFHDRLGQHLIVFSKAGAVRGRHYHKGISITKNPEVLLLLSGAFIVNWRALPEERIQSARVAGPARIEIPPYTWHELIAETDGALIEMNSLSEHSADVFYL